jgi:hypothetical protein
MPTYRIIMNGEPTENYIAESSYIEAYFTAARMLPPAYKHDFRLKEIT